MMINAFARAASGFSHKHPIFRDVNVEELTEPLQSLAGEAIAIGTLPSYLSVEGRRWVMQAELAAAVGWGRRLYDSHCPYFVPPKAIAPTFYLSEPITAATMHWQREFLKEACHKAEYLARLQDDQPPRPFDLHVHGMASLDLPLRGLIGAGAIEVHHGYRGWWVSSDEVLPMLSLGDSLDDPASAWYVDVHDRADHDEVDRLIAEHRRYWPEIYGLISDNATSRNSAERNVWPLASV